MVTRHRPLMADTERLGGRQHLGDPSYDVPPAMLTIRLAHRPRDMQRLRPFATKLAEAHLLRRSSFRRRPVATLPGGSEEAGRLQ